MLLILFSNRLGARIRCSLSSFPPAGEYGVLSLGGGTSLHTVRAAADAELVVLNRVTNEPNNLLFLIVVSVRRWTGIEVGGGVWTVWRREETRAGLWWIKLKPLRTCRQRWEGNIIVGP